MKHLNAILLVAALVSIPGCVYDGAVTDPDIVRIKDGPGVFGQWKAERGDSVFYLELFDTPTQSPLMPDISGGGLYGPRKLPKRWQRFRVEGDLVGDSLVLEVNYGPDWRTGLDVRVDLSAHPEDDDGFIFRRLAAEFEDIGFIGFGRPPP